MLNKIIKSSFLSLITILLVNLNVFSETSTINFDGYLKRVTVYEYYNDIRISRDIFRKNLGKTKQQIIAEFWKNYPKFFRKNLMSTQSENYNGYELLIISGEIYTKNKAIYVLQSGICIGYTINSYIGITNFLNDSRIIALKSLQRNQGYLSSIDLTQYTQIEDVNVYQATVGSFTERYITIKHNLKSEFVLSYSFYPTSLESKFNPDIINIFKYNINEINTGTNGAIAHDEYRNARLNVKKNN